ncbi:hypothetical protein BJG93_30235 (plasmid) [Paraburkholderia sprentiae WSM5005]|uniref:Uncharacterized protein n=1 Tax=Paraburkholderia sprentiae WSM5005 TaxID=754502 RepID=A0A1I9YU76_9BURK|nr:hypothetical protein [Paraburkholderia sprentiae]APA89750.1 hypothetical protein BJG93_30235 [Paraburkholderia sprentiae WSM5005]
MPVDFARVPPRIAVPAPPQLSKPVWTVLLGVVLCLGAALTIAVWPKGRSTNTAWFWFCVFGYPMLAWAFLLCIRLGYLYVRRSAAVAANRVSDREAERCHALASEPLTLLGHAWCFSADRGENGIEGLADGSLALRTRTSRAEPNTDVSARWIELPDQQFYAGNELTECARHQAVCNWLLVRLIDSLAPQLAALPARTALHIEASLHCALEAADVRARLQQLVSAKSPSLRVTINPPAEPSSVFQTDAWFDRMKPQVAHLLVAVQLRNAVSERLQDGVAEVGVALLLGHPSLAKTRTESPLLRLHRPARGPADAVGKTLEHAMRWGQTTSTHIGAVWSHGLSPELEAAIRSAPQLGGQRSNIDLKTTVGDCGEAGGWLATALAAELAARTGDPQLILTREGSDLIALMCRKQT